MLVSPHSEGLSQCSYDGGYVLDEPTLALAFAIPIAVTITIGPSTLWFRLTIGFTKQEDF